MQTTTGWAWRCKRWQFKCKCRMWMSLPVRCLVMLEMCSLYSGNGWRRPPLVLWNLCASMWECLPRCVKQFLRLFAEKSDFYHKENFKTITECQQKADIVSIVFIVTFTINAVRIILLSSQFHAMFTILLSVLCVKFKQTVSAYSQERTFIYM